MISSVCGLPLNECHEKHVDPNTKDWIPSHKYRSSITVYMNHVWIKKQTAG